MLIIERKAKVDNNVIMRINQIEKEGRKTIIVLKKWSILTSHHSFLYI